MKNKNKILLIGYSNIARRRYINSFKKNKIPFCVASKSFTKKIKGAYKQFNDYNKALNQSHANIVFLSLPNSMHFYWSKKILKLGFHLIVDKPITTKVGELDLLISIARKKKLLLTEATFFNYHEQFKFLKKFIGKLDNIEQVLANFTIPMPKQKSILLSKKLHGGALMDMSPYAAAINRIFFNENLKQKEIIVKKNIQGLVISFDLFIRYETKIFIGTFRFGKEYKNTLTVYNDDRFIDINRVFSPPDDLGLTIVIDKNNKSRSVKIKKDDCFENFFLEFIKNLKEKKFTFYHNRMIRDESFRLKLLK